MLNVVELQDNLIAWIDSQLSIKLYEEGVPDARTLKKVKGQVEPYAAIQPGMPQRRGGGTGFAGVRYNDYTFPFQIQVIAANPTQARKIACGELFNAALGFSQDWTGEMEQRPGGQMFSITTSNGATEAYQYATSWGFTGQLTEIP
mgnify:FL=1